MEKDQVRSKTYDQLVDHIEDTGWMPLDESSLARIHSHLQDRNLGIVSAERGKYADQPGVNRNRGKDLERDIRSHGLGFVRLKGNYIEGHGTPQARKVSERSYLVVGHRGEDNGHMLGFLRKVGGKYNQDSVVHVHAGSGEARLVGTQDKDEEGHAVTFPGKGKTHVLGKWHPQKVGEFYSSMKGKTFTFESFKADVRGQDVLYRALCLEADRAETGVHDGDKQTTIGSQEAP